MTFIYLFCIYGNHHVGCINNILIPALKKQQTPAKIKAFFLNYQDNQRLIKEEHTELIEIIDYSGQFIKDKIGYAEGINYLFNQSQPANFFITINPDALPMDNCFNKLISNFSENIAIVEARQWPNEHPKEYDGNSHVTPWASGACALFNAKVFASLGGFDTINFLYNEDVDYSWRSWQNGYKVIYQPDAIVIHLTGSLHYRRDRYYFEHFLCGRGFLVLAYKFFGIAGEKKALKYLKGSLFPEKLQEYIKASYFMLKTSIALENKIHQMIKILGYNLYHKIKSK